MNIAMRMLIIIACVLPCGNSFAAGDKAGSFNFSALFGLSKPVHPSEYGNNYSMGYDILGQFGYTFNSKATILPILMEYQSSKAKEKLSGRLFSGTFSSFSFTPSLMLGANNEENVNPFFLMGMGLYWRSYDQYQSGINKTIKNTNFGINLGGGLEFSLSDKVSLISNVKYHYVFNPGDRIGCISFSVGVNYYLLN